MKSALVLLAVIGSCFAASLDLSGEKFEKVRPLYEKYGKDKAEEAVAQFLEACSLTEDDIEKVVAEVEAKVEAIDFESKTVCKIIEDDLVNTLESVASALDEGCNKKNNLGPIGQFALSTVRELVVQFCKADGEHLLELLNPCASQNIDEIEECVTRVGAQYEENIENGFKTFSVLDTICHGGKDVVEECLRPEIRKTCKLQITKDSLHAFAEAAFAHCPISEKQLDETYQKLTAVDYSSKTVCQFNDEDFINVFDDLATLLDTNCNKKHNFGEMASFVMHVIKELTHGFCHAEGEKILELMHPCITKNVDVMEECFTRQVELVSDNVENHFQDMNMVDTVCGLVHNIHEECIKPEVEHNCKLDITKSAVFGFHGSLVRSCPIH